jgi:hypothetical protein
MMCSTGIKIVSFYNKDMLYINPCTKIKDKQLFSDKQLFKFTAFDHNDYF